MFWTLLGALATNKLASCYVKYFQRQPAVLVALVLDKRAQESDRTVGRSAANGHVCRLCAALAESPIVSAVRTFESFIVCVYIAVRTAG
jgi:hypothetical protein